MTFREKLKDGTTKLSGEIINYPVTPPTPYLRAHRITAFDTGTASTWKDIVWDSINDALGGFVAPVAGVIIIPEDGLYKIDAKLLWTASTSTILGGIGIQGITPVEYAYNTKSGTANLAATARIDLVVPLLEGDDVTIIGQSNLAAHSLNISSAGFNTVTIAKVGVL